MSYPNPKGAAAVFARFFLKVFDNFRKYLDTDYTDFF
jgi:hypothetical protein